MDSGTCVAFYKAVRGRSEVAHAIARDTDSWHSDDDRIFGEDTSTGRVAHGIDALPEMENCT